MLAFFNRNINKVRFVPLIHWSSRDFNANSHYSPILKHYSLASICQSKHRDTPTFEVNFNGRFYEHWSLLWPWESSCPPLLTRTTSIHLPVRSLLSPDLCFPADSNSWCKPFPDQLPLCFTRKRHPAEPVLGHGAGIPAKSNLKRKCWYISEELLT